MVARSDRSFNKVLGIALLAGLSGVCVAWGGPAVPEGWRAFEGARSGDGKASTAAAGPDGGIVLEGDAETRVWTCLARPFAVTAGATYRVSFEARATGVRRDPGQFQSCYVGAAVLDAGGKTLELEVADILQADWTAGTVAVRAPAGATRGEIRVFISKTGRLEARAVRVEEDRPERSFDVLVEDMDRHYSYFDHRKIDWPALVAKHRPRVEPAAADPRAFADAVGAMLAELRDGHVWIDAPGAPRSVPFAGGPGRDDFDGRAVGAKLRKPRQIGTIAFCGRTAAEGYGYLAVGSLAGHDVLFGEIEAALAALLDEDPPGFILDLRPNQGGDERRAQRIAAYFADERRVYARSKVRSGPRHTDFVESPERTIAPVEGRKPYTKPIVCLIGPRCVSSGEGFAKMIAVLPHAVLAGRPTRGASGNPGPIALPNGVTVWYSRWVDLLPDGTCPEGKGLAPAVPIPLAPEGTAGDPTFEAGVRLLGERIGRAGGR